MSETTSRVLTLLDLLQTYRQWAGPALARRLGVTERTLRRDIERLRELGYRVEATRGAAGGYRLEAGSQLPPLLLNDDEAVTMAVGLRLAADEGLDDGERTTLSALAKFEQVLPPALRERVNAVGGLVRSARPRETTVPQEMLGQLALACRDRERIRFHYVAADGTETDRVVEPHSVVSTSRTWFLLCWDLRRGDWRTFRLDRMSRFFGTRVHFEQRALPERDAAAYLERAMAAQRRRYRAEVVVELPIDRFREHLGRWSAGAEAIGDERTRWPIDADSIEGLLSGLVWMPAGVEYSISAAPDVVERAGAMLAQMQSAVADARVMTAG
ncbi:WYL domain-containing protein [Microbacteriaceae bacterium VKM Ac-2855]|nr:WYL domain-containing protein [Microbacteriaceae bacterium VKM Ac-2855]